MCCMMQQHQKKKELKKKKLNQIICISSALKKIIENEIKNCDVEINVLHDATTPKKKELKKKKL